jgi:hypothetical protein
LMVCGVGGYVGGGVTYANRVHGKTLTVHGWVSMMPHPSLWRAAAGLVRDGQTFTANTLNRGRGGGAGQASLLRHEGRLAASPNKQKKEVSGKSGKKDKKGQKKKTNESSGGRQRASDEPPAASVGECGGGNRGIAGSTATARSAPSAKAAVGTTAGGGGRWIHVE